MLIAITGKDNSRILVNVAKERGQRKIDNILSPFF